MSSSSGSISPQSVAGRAARNLVRPGVTRAMRHRIPRKSPGYRHVRARICALPNTWQDAIAKAAQLADSGCMPTEPIFAPVSYSRKPS